MEAPQPLQHQPTLPVELGHTDPLLVVAGIIHTGQHVMDALALYPHADRPVRVKPIKAEVPIGKPGDLGMDTKPTNGIGQLLGCASGLLPVINVDHCWALIYEMTWFPM